MLAKMRKPPSTRKPPILRLRTCSSVPPREFVPPSGDGKETSHRLVLFPATAENACGGPSRTVKSHLVRSAGINELRVESPHCRRSAGRRRQRNGQQSS